MKTLPPKAGQVRRSGRSEAGFTILLFAICALVMIGAVGLAVDVGRVYIAKSEAQVFTDSASIAATLELDGTAAGLVRARARANSNTNKWNFNTTSFGTTTTSFAKDANGPWEELPITGVGYMYARASATAEVPVYFMGMFRAAKPLVSEGALFVTAAPTFTTGVKADSAAGQQLKESFSEGLFPFSPYAHSEIGPHFGLTAGEKYTFRWPSNPKMNVNVCPGDRDVATITLSEAGGGSERGYIEETSASVIRQTIVDDYQTVVRTIGESAIMTGGAKGTMGSAVVERISQDANSTATSYASYVASGIGSGRRIVAMPINVGHPTYRIVQIGAFFLSEVGRYGQGGNQAWCAEYLGPWVQGAKTKGAADGSGAYIVRLAK